MEFTLLTAAAVAAGATWATLRWEARRGNAADCTRDLWDLALTSAVVGVAVGRLAAMIGDGVNPAANLGDVIIVRAGVATGPAAIAALAWVAWSARRELAIVADGIAAAALAGLGAWHGSCLLREACLGSASDLPWAYAQPGSTITRHPVELYAAILLVLSAAALARVRMRGLAGGVAAGVALAVAGAVRLGTEPLRPSLGGGPTLWYLAAIAVGIGVVVASVRTRSGSKPPG